MRVNVFDLGYRRTASNSRTPARKSMGGKVHKAFPKTWFALNHSQGAEAPNLASFDNRWGRRRPTLAAFRLA